MKKLPLLFAFLLAITSCTKEMPGPAQYPNQQNDSPDAGYYSYDDGGDNSGYDSGGDNSGYDSGDDNGDDSGDGSGDDSGDDSGNRYHTHRHNSRPLTTITSSPANLRTNPPTGW